MPPPLPLVPLPEKVLLVTVSVPLLEMPPPPEELLKENVQLVTVRVLVFSMPPPWLLDPEPWAMVRFCRFNVPPETLKTRFALFPLNVTFCPRAPWGGE